MEKYLNYDGLSKLWTKTKYQDTLTLNAAKNYTSEQITLAKNELQLKINGNSFSITALNGYIPNGVANKALGDKNGNDITATYMLANLRGAANGVCPLGSDSKIPNSYLPSYVDDVLEYNSLSNFPTTGEAGKIYVDKATNKTYRWSGSQYTEISSSLALGTTTGTAFDGGKGQALETKVSTIENNYVKSYNESSDGSIRTYIETLPNEYRFSKENDNTNIISTFSLFDNGIGITSDLEDGRGSILKSSGIALAPTGALLVSYNQDTELQLGIKEKNNSLGFYATRGDVDSELLDTSMAITDAELDELLV